MNDALAPRMLIASDLDGTLVGDAPALARLNRDLARARARFALVYVTGRVLPSVLGLIEAEGLLAPDAIVAAVGTTIHHAPSWEADPGWTRRMAFGWDAAAVDAAASALVGLVPQPAAACGPYKRSYWVAPEDAHEAMAALARELRRRGAPARFIYSSGRDLDVVPLRGGKGVATRFVAAQLGIPAARIIACGDSGNDVDLLAAGGAAAIVANAQPELLRRAPAHAYLATAPFAGGVHEALRRFGVV